MKTRIMAGMVGIALAAATANADFYEQRKVPQGHQAEVIASSFDADRTKSSEGSKPFDLNQTAITAGLKMWTSNYFAAASVPYLDIRNSTANQSAEGFGDVAAEAGRFMFVGKWYGLLTAQAKFPTADHDAARKANLGTGNLDVGAMLRVGYDAGSWTLDGAIGHTHKDEPYHDSLNLRLTPGVRLGTPRENLRLGIETVLAVEEDVVKTLDVAPIVRYTRGPFQIGASLGPTFSENGAEGTKATLRVRYNF